MAKAATPVGGALVELPPMSAEVAAFFEQEANVKPKVTVPSISPGGKKWTLSLDGQDTVLSKTNAEGDIEPIQIFKAFVLAHAERRGRAYYVGGYDPAKPGVPVCWSDDGIKPHDKVEVKQNPTCEGCPMAAKGSKITDNNKSVRACSEHRMLALIPSSKLDFPFLRLKIAMTSDWDGQSPDHDAAGWYAWSNYLDVLRARMPNACHTARVVTKMKFDPNVDYPKILFQMDRGTKPEEAAALVPRMRAEKATLDALISGTFSPNGRDGTRTDEPDDTQAPAPSASKPQGGAPAAAAPAPATTGPTPAQQALAAAKKTLAEAEAAANAPPPPPAETPKQKALREAKEALAAAEAEAAGEGTTSEAEAAGSDDDDGEINLPDGAGTVAQAAEAPKAVNGAAAGGAKPAGKAAAGKAAGAGKGAAAPAASAPPAAGTAALKGLLTDWE